MEQNQKPDKPLHPHLAGLIGEFALHAPDPSSPLGRAWQFMAGSGRRQLVSGAVVSVVAIGISLTLAAYYTSFTLGKTELGASLVSAHASDTALQQQLSQQAAGYSFSVTYPDNSKQTYKLIDAGITVNDSTSIGQMRQTVRGLGWQRFAWWHTSSTPLTVTKNNASMNKFIAEHVAIKNQPASNASLTIKSGKPVVADGANGSTYQLAGGNRRLVLAAQRMQPYAITLETTVVKPQVSATDLSAAAAKISSYTGHSVSFVIDDRTVTASPSDVGNWLDVEVIPAKKTADVTVNSGKIQAYVAKMASSSIHPARAQITITGDDGSTQVLSAGQSGTNITNEDAAVKSVASQLEEPGSVITANLAVSHEDFKTISAADYPKWLVADVTTKRMYAYEHGTLVRSFLISAGAPKTPTVLGTYQIYSKVPVKTMRGANADGSRYVQPNVKYVNYFYKDYAVHGNYWRPASVFGNVNTSHGCLGITDSDAEWIYNWAPIGTTVITHD